MGIDGIYDYIRQKVIPDNPDAVQGCTLKSLQKKAKEENKNLTRRPRITFDGNAFAYKFRYGNHPFSHLIQSGWLVADVLIEGMEPVFMFDGEHPEEKDEENQRRKAEKQQFMTNITSSQQDIKRRKLECGFNPNQSIDSIPEEMIPKEKLKDYEEIQRMEDHLDDDYGSKIILTPEHVEDMKELLRYLGVWVIQAPSEGEAHCALMNNLGDCEFAAGDDGDMFPFGAKYIVRDIGWRSKREEKMQIYDVRKIVKGMGLTPDQLVDVCVLCINDYNKTCRVDGLGFCKCTLGIQKYGNIEAFFKAKLKENDKKRGKKVKGKPVKLFEVPDGFNYVGIRKIFADVLHQKEIPKEFTAGNPYKFDMKKACYFFHRKDMTVYLRDLCDWAKIMEGKSYTIEECEEMINECIREEEEAEVNAFSQEEGEDMEEDEKEDEDECIFDAV